MNATEKGKAHYYAFISHKSTDAKFALKLQRFIETYDLPAHIFDEMAHFFTVYKNLEGKEAMAGDVNDRKAAVDVIRKSIDSYIDNFCK